MQSSNVSVRSRIIQRGHVGTYCCRLCPKEQTNAQAEDPQSCREAVQGDWHWQISASSRFRNHLLDHKTPKQKRHLATKAVVDRTDEERVTLMMPYA